MCLIYIMSLISYDKFRAIFPSSDITTYNLIWWHFYNSATFNFPRHILLIRSQFLRKIYSFY